MNATKKPSLVYYVVARGSSVIKKNLRLLIGIAMGIFIVVTYNLFYSARDWYREQKQHDKLLIAQQTEKNTLIKNSGLINEMSHVVDQMHDELNNSPNRMLSDETISRIAALSYSFIPYYHVEGDSISSKKLSPERGQLLLVISGMKIDTISLQKIFQHSIFASANLAKANLQNAFLKGINLKGAILRGANLEGVNLNEAHITSADLWGTNLKYASMISADLTSADLSWSDLNGAKLVGAKLNKAFLKSSQIRNADLSNVSLQRADLSGALLNETNLQGADMLSVIMNRTNLSRANLSKINMKTSTLIEANLTETIFIGATINKVNFTGALVQEKNWFLLLDEWKVVGANEIASQYRLEADSTALIPQYYLFKRDK
ncbi:hypothetical protein LBMAG27_14310 [Bacteroidota bacterium]|nr:hypothetical protein LBMAG27_14310 [Bacteroidota bacterium]